jgi:hypothetical protein
MIPSENCDYSDMGSNAPTRRGRKRVTELLATEAITVLCYHAFVGIRAMAYATSKRDQPEPETLEWTRVLADVCHNLPLALRPSVAGKRTHRATAAMRYLWETSNAVKREWIAETLLGEGIRIEKLIEPTSR